MDMKKETFADRLNLAMKESGVNQPTLAEAIGIRQPSVWKMTTGKTQNPRRLLEIARVLGVRPEWLSKGEGPMHENGSDTEPTNIKESRLKAVVWEDVEQDRDEFVTVPLLNVVLSAGNGNCQVEESEEFSLIFRRYYLSKIGVPESAAKLVRVTGNSMEPTLHDGDVVGVNTQDTTIRDGKTYAICQADLLRVKTLIATPTTVIIRSINRDEYPDEVMSREEFQQNVRVIGKVFWSSHSW